MKTSPFSAVYTIVNVSVQVKINIPSLPAIGASDRLHCTMETFRSEGTMSESSQVSCDLPQPSLIPQTPEDKGIFINSKPAQIISYGECSPFRLSVFTSK